MHHLNSSYKETSFAKELYDSTSEDDCISSPRNTEKGATFNVQEKIKELMAKPSPVSTLQKKAPRFLGKKKTNGDINRGVFHNIKRPKLKKVKEWRLNNARQTITKVKTVRSPPRLATNRSPVKLGQVKRHKLSSPGISYLDSPQASECESGKKGMKFFTSRSKSSATVKINDTIKLSATNGEIKIHQRQGGFEKKNIGRHIEKELEKKIAAASLQSHTNTYRLDCTLKLPSVAIRLSPPKPTRVPSSPSSRKPKSQPSTPKRAPNWASPSKYAKKSPRMISPRKSGVRQPQEGLAEEIMRMKGHRSLVSSAILKAGSPLKREPCLNGREDDLQDLDLALDQIEARSMEDEILSSLIKENQTPEKILNSPKRSPRKHLNTSTKEELTPQRKAKKSPRSNRNVKYFPIFESKAPQPLDVHTVEKNTPPANGRKRFLMKKLDKSQLVIDAGQRNFGARFCQTCGFLYDSGDPEEEENHLKFHDPAPPSLKYPGWNHECQVTNLDHLGGRVIKVGPMDSSHWWRKVNHVLECVDSELGFSESGIQRTKDTTAFLYILDKTIVGVLIAESIDKAYRVIHSDSGGAEGDTSKLICCSDTPQKVAFGISRIWVLSTQRRRGIASRLVDAMRANVVPHYYLAENNFAFSDPTQFGMHFAEKYTKRTDFLVYRRE